MKIIFIFLSTFCFLFGNFGGKISIKLPKQEDSSMIKIPALDLKVGESGILQREVNGNNFIIANLVVEKIDDGIALIAFKSFDDLEQDYTVSYTHLTLPTTVGPCRSRWSPYH